jgi:ABC-type branched-subunit amino acid transport system substrate-binding protein
MGIARLFSSASGVALTGLAVAIGVGMAPAARAADEPIRFGGLFSMTGGAALSGQVNQMSAKLGIDEINEAGGILGRKITFIQADDQTDPTQAVSEMRRLISQEKIQLAVGPLISQFVIATAPLLTEAKIASMHTGASAAITPQILPYGFSMFASSDAQGKAMVRYAIETRKAKSAAILTDNGALSKAAQGAMKEALAARQIPLTGLQEHEFRTTDLTPQLLSLRQGNPDIILLITVSGADAGLVLKTLNDIGWKVPVISPTLSNVVPEVLTVAGPDAFKSGNAIGVTYKAFTYCPGDNSDQSPYAKLVAKVKALQPQQFDHIPLATVSWLHDGVYLLKAAAEATKSLEGPAIAQWIEDNARTLKGLPTGELSASKTNHFLIGDNALEPVEHPDVRSPAFLIQRAGC